MVPVKSYNDFSGPLVEKRVVWVSRNHSGSVWTHFYHKKVTYERLCDRSVVEDHLDSEFSTFSHDLLQSFFYVCGTCNGAQSVAPADDSAWCFLKRGHKNPQKCLFKVFLSEFCCSRHSCGNLCHRFATCKLCKTRWCDSIVCRHVWNVIPPPPSEIESWSVPIFLMASSDLARKRICNLSPGKRKIWLSVLSFSQSTEQSGHQSVEWK